MAVAVLNSAAGITSAGVGGINTVAVSAGTGSDRVLYALTYRENATVSAASYAGAAMTLVASFGNARLWSKTAPASGSNTLSMTTTEGFQTQYVIVALSGVDQATPHGSVVSSSGTSAAAASGSVTVPTDGLALAFMTLGFASAAPTATSPSTLRGAHRDGGGGHSVAGASRTTTGAVAWSHDSAAWTVRALPINAVVVPGIISGDIGLDPAVAAGDLTTSASDLGGNVAADASVAAGTLGSQPGTVTTAPLKSKFTGALQIGVTIPKVAYLRVSDMANVLNVVDAVTDGSGRIVTSNAALVAGTKYLVVTCNSDGSAFGAEPYIAT